MASVGSDLTLGDISEQAAGSGIIMAGQRTLTLISNNTYSGETLVNSGTLALSGNGSIATSPNITVASGATLNVSARTDGTLTLTGGQTLKGNGTITGILAAGAGSTVSPGTSIGTLTVSGDITLSGTTRVELNKMSGTNDALQSGGTLFYGGTLSLTNLAGTLAAGDSFQLFSAAFYSGAFNAIVPPTPGPGLRWDTGHLTSDGTLRIIAVPQPGFASVMQSGTNIVMSGTNGLPNETFDVLSSTNVALPLINWATIATQMFDSNGNFNFTNALDTNTPQRFFFIRVP